MTSTVGKVVRCGAAALVCLMALLGCEKAAPKPPPGPQPREASAPEEANAAVAAVPAEEANTPQEAVAPEPAAPSEEATPTKDSAKPGDTAMKITITSSAFKHNEPIPRKYTGEGADVSPPLSWTGVPDGTKELALIMDDPDAPTAEPWVHWVIYKLPPTLTSLPEAVPRTEMLKEPAGATQGNNTWPAIGYRGPMPPPGHGVHHYHFKLYALDTALDVQPGLDKNRLLAAVKGHILAEGKLIGTYER